MGDLSLLFATALLFLVGWALIKALDYLAAIRSLLVEINHRDKSRTEGREEKLMEQLETIRSLLADIKNRK